MKKILRQVKLKLKTEIGNYRYKNQIKKAETGEDMKNAIVENMVDVFGTYIKQFIDEMVDEYRGKVPNELIRQKVSDGILKMVDEIIESKRKVLIDALHEKNYDWDFVEFFTIFVDHTLEEVRETLIDDAENYLDRKLLS